MAIADLSVEGEVVICGKVKYFGKKISAKNRVYFTFTLWDKSANIRVSVFPNKGRIGAIDKLGDDALVYLEGRARFFNDKLSISAKDLSIIENFVLV